MRNTTNECFLIELRPAKGEDFTILGVPNYECFYWLKSKLTGVVEGPYLFTEKTNKDEFKRWYKHGMVYVTTDVNN